MGYITNYRGDINLFDKKAINILKKLIKNSEYPFENTEENIYINSGKNPTLQIDCNWKDYEDEMEKLCLFVSTLDKKAKGIICCGGEEGEDVWRIIINDGKILLEYGEIKYMKGVEFKDMKIKKEVYKITKDKKLMKELMLDSLE